MTTRRIVIVLAAAVLLGSWSSLPVRACPFCSGQGQTLTKEVLQAKFVVLGRLENARLNANAGGLDNGTTDLVIEMVVKDHPVLRGKKRVVLPRYLPPVEKDKQIKYLVFCDYFKGRIDPYRGIPTRDDSLAVYLKGATALDPKDTATKLAFFFDYLDHPDVEIATDAYKEFSNADNKEVMAMIENGDRAKIRKKLIEWLTDKETPSYRFGLYGYMLGLCGSSEDGDVLLGLLKQPRRLVSGLDGVLAGYILLRPTEGWQFTLGILGDAGKNFTRRYAALRTIRFFWQYRPDVLPPETLIAGLRLLLQQGDIADLAIEDLRKWKQWQLEDEVLALFGKESHNAPIVHRAILRYALTCPGKKSAAFIKEQRQRNPDRVRDVEELLQFDQPAPAAGSGK